MRGHFWLENARPGLFAADSGRVRLRGSAAARVNTAVLVFSGQRPHRARDAGRLGSNTRFSRKDSLKSPRNAQFSVNSASSGVYFSHFPLHEPLAAQAGWNDEMLRISRARMLMFAFAQSACVVYEPRSTLCVRAHTYITGG